MNYIKAISKDGFIRAFVADTTQVVETARKYHNTSPVCSAALGRTLTAAMLMGSTLKNENETLTLQFDGGGPIGKVIAVSDWQGNVRGTLTNSLVDLPLNSIGKLDVAAAVGTDGYLSVVKGLGMNTPYVSRIDIVSGEIGDDICAYYMQSEQVPTACGVGVLVDVDYSIKAAGGFIIQLLPGAPDSLIDALEGSLYTLDSVTDMISSGLTPQGILHEILLSIPYEIIEERELSYVCPCDRERFAVALSMLEVSALEEMAQDENGINTECHFCDKSYKFSQEEIKAIIQAKNEKIMLDKRE